MVVRKSAQTDRLAQNPQPSPGTVSPGASLSSNLAIEHELAYWGQAQLPFGSKIGPGPHCRDSRPASWPIPLKPEPSNPRPSKPKPCKPNPPKLEPSKLKPRKPKPPRFNAKPNKSGASEKSSPPNEDPRLRIEVPTLSNGCSPPNRELPNRAAFGPVREWEDVEVAVKLRSCQRRRSLGPLEKASMDV